METTYHRVTYKDGNRSKTIILSNMRESKTKIGVLISGTAVNKEGEETVKKFDQIDIISKSLITKITELDWNLKYGTLEVKNEDLEKENQETINRSKNIVKTQ